MIIIFYHVRLKWYLVRPQTKVHPALKRGERNLFIHSVRLYSVFPFKTLKNVTDTVCGGETYTVTQIQADDSHNFCVCRTAPGGLEKE